MKYFLGLLVVGLLSKKSDADADKCYVGTDTLVEVACKECKNLPIEIMLILDDSSSIRTGTGGNQFPNEIDFAKAMVLGLKSAFGTVRVGAVFFSECMAGESPQGDWLLTSGSRGNFDCSVGSKTTRYSMVSADEMIDILNKQDNGKHWGTPLSVGYDMAFEEMQLTGTKGRMRVVLMISDGEPTRPYYPPDCRTYSYIRQNQAIPAGCGKLDHYKIVDRCDANATQIKNNGLISLTIRVDGDGGIPAIQHMRRWASEPRDIWAISNVGDFKTLKENLNRILGVFCFYINTISNLDDPTKVINCVKTNDLLRMTGKNLFDMGQDKIIVDNEAEISDANSYGFDLGKEYVLTEVRIKANEADIQQKTFEIATGVCTDWTPLTNELTPVYKNNNDFWHWQSEFNTPEKQAKCVRVTTSKDKIQEFKIYAKGGTDQRPSCRFQSKKTDKLYYSDGKQADKDGKSFECRMPDTSGDYGNFIVEISREGGENGAYTANRRTIRHADTNCVVPTSPNGDGNVPNLGSGLSLSPTPSFYMPTEKSLIGFGTSQSPLNLFIIFFSILFNYCF